MSPTAIVRREEQVMTPSSSDTNLTLYIGDTNASACEPAPPFPDAQLDIEPDETRSDELQISLFIAEGNPNAAEI